jgi:hypothetical protein
MVGPIKELLEEGGLESLKHKTLRVSFGNVFTHPKEAKGRDIRQKSSFMAHIQYFPDSVPPFARNKKEPNKKGKDQKKIDFWEKSKLLSLDSMICFFQVRDEKPQPRFLARINRKEAAELASGNPRFGVSIGDIPLDILSELLHETGNLAQNRTSFLAIPVCSSFFAYEFVLRRLQDIQKFPFTSEFLKLTVRSQVLSIPLPDELLTSDTLNAEQKDAVRVAVEHRVSLIQGPPGTGKTYVGTLIASHFYQKTSLKILCVCYTNHALDQFLESLIDKNLKSILRIGGGCKSETLQTYRLQKKAATDKDSKKSSFQLYKEIEAAYASARKGLKRITCFIGKNQFKQGRDFWAFLKSNYNSVFREFVVPVQAGGLKVDESYRFNCWLEGSTAAGVDQNSPTWRLTIKQRKEEVRKWEREIRAGLSKEVIGDLDIIDRTINKIQEVRFQSTDAQAMREARIVGLTTSGAAKNHHLLEEYKPDIVIIEEAGEVLEAHAITSIIGARHLVLIGDHKQLRPKVENYSLTVEAKMGGTLNISLFERLVDNKYGAHVQLKEQHRMHPDISDLVSKLFYDGSLKVGRRVLQREVDLPSGLFRAVNFWNHNLPEDDSGFEKSKTNISEANLVINIVKYLIAQGNSPSQVTILTPYLGQLLVLRDKIKENKFKANLGELDVKEIENTPYLQLSPGPAGPAVGPDIRVATIDNYQGEESDVIVLSLVRSNSGFKVGFLSSSERINVMLSRARLGMVIVGDLDTLQKSKSSEKLREFAKLVSPYVESGLLCACPKHRESPVLLSEATILSGQICSKPCSLGPLSCGHKCPDPCHSKSLHDRVKCVAYTESACKEGHYVFKECFRKGECSTCQSIEKTRKDCENRERKLEQDRRNLENEFAKKKEKLEAEEKMKMKEMENERRKLELEKDLEVEKRAFKLAAIQSEHEEHRKRIRDQIKKDELEQEEKLKKFEREAEEAKRRSEEQRKRNLERLGRETEEKLMKRRRELELEQLKIEGAFSCIVCDRELLVSKDHLIPCENCLAIICPPCFDNQINTDELGCRRCRNRFSPNCVLLHSSAKVSVDYFSRIQDSVILFTLFAYKKRLCTLASGRTMARFFTTSSEEVMNGDASSLLLDKKSSAFAESKTKTSLILSSTN